MKLEDMTLQEAQKYTDKVYTISAQGVIEVKMEDAVSFSSRFFSDGVVIKENCFTTREEASHCFKYFRLGYLEKELEEVRKRIRSSQAIEKDLQRDIKEEKNRISKLK